jgi:hypothetical protein
VIDILSVEILDIGRQGETTILPASDPITTRQKRRTRGFAILSVVLPPIVIGVMPG